MDGFFAWLSALWENFKFFIIVEGWEQGCRFRRGVPEPTPLGAGVWFYWPVFDRIEVIPVRLSFIDLIVQSITTSDGVEIALSANIGYEIVDAVKAYTAVHDHEDSLGKLARGHLHRRIHEWKYEELVGSLGKLEDSLEKTLTTRSKPWGILIRDVAITDLVKQRAYRIFGDAGLARQDGLGL